MSICVEELEALKLYSRPLYLPVNDKDRKHGSAIFLLTPNFTSSKDLMYPSKNKLGNINFNSYYLERDVTYYIHTEANEILRSFDNLVLENGELTILPVVENTLSQFRKECINEELISEHIEKCSSLSGIVEYFPWDGYLYLDEADNIVAGVNVNIEDKFIQKIFVTESRYNYLYKDLIQEARNMKANEISLAKNDPAITHFKDFGFTECDADDDRVRLQFKISIEEETTVSNVSSGLLNHLNSKPYYTNNKYLDNELNAIAFIALDLCEELNLDYDICYLMSKACKINGDPYEVSRIIQNDMKLHTWMNSQQISMAKLAIVEALDKDHRPTNVYSKVLKDSIALARMVNIDVAIHYERLELEKKLGHQITMDDVDTLCDIMEMKYGRQTANDFYVNHAYFFYRRNNARMRSIISRGLKHRIIQTEEISIIESATNNIIVSALTESHITFGYDKETFESPSSSKTWADYKSTLSETPSELSFTSKAKGKTRGIVIREDKDIKGVVTVDSTNRITEMNASDLKPEYLILVATKKFGANKVIVPESCKLIHEAFSKSGYWEKTHHVKTGDVFTTHETAMEYKDIPLDETTRMIYNNLPDKDKAYMGNQYCNENCVSNTIYRKTYKDLGFVDLYMMPFLDESMASVDIAVLPKGRGQGIAKKLIQEAEAHCREHFPKIKALKWVCEENNMVSFNLAKHCGFLPSQQGNGYRFLFKILVKGHKQPVMMNPVTESAVIDEDTTISAAYATSLEGKFIDSNTAMLLNEDVDEMLSGKTYDNKFRRILWDDRIRTSKQILTIYDDIKEDNRTIRNVYLDLDRYKGLNLYIDLAFYNISYFSNVNKTGKMSSKLSSEMYMEFMKRMINDSRISNIYNKRTVFVPVLDWCGSAGKDPMEKLDFNKNINPVSCLLYYARYKPDVLTKCFPGVNFIFWSKLSFFKLNFDEYEKKNFAKFNIGLENIIKKTSDDIDKEADTAKAIVNTIADKLEVAKGIKINNITGGTDKISKEDLENSLANRVVPPDQLQDARKASLVQAVQKAAEKSADTDTAIANLDSVENFDRDYIKNLIDNIESEEDGNVKVSAARLARMKSLNDKFLETKIDNRTIKDMLSDNKDESDLPIKALPVDSINDDWKQIRFASFEEKYNVNADIYSILTFFENRSAKLAIRDITVNDTSTSEDWKYTYTVDFEDINGKRFKFKFDIPKLKSNRFMKIGGNDKNISGQLVLLPVSKTDIDTVQMVSNYNKIFIRRYGNGSGKSTISADLLVKTLEDYAKTHKNVTLTYGDNTLVCSKYELPYDYLDLASIYSKIEVKVGKVKFIYYFDQDELRKNYKIEEEDRHIPYGVRIVDGGKPEVLYYFRNDITLSAELTGRLCELLPDFDPRKFKASVKHMYSKASILATDIPVILIMAYSEGLQASLKKGKVRYRIVDKREKMYPNEDRIKFKDGYIYYVVDYLSSLLMNGLKELDTAEHSLTEMDKKSMWTEFLDDFGGRIKADGLDNFYDLMMDPITVEVCEKYKLPTDYVEMLGYANMLLADTSYTMHTELSSNRYRTNELIAAYTYKCIATAYADYKNQLKRNRTGVVLTMKQSAIIDAIMADPTCADLSILNPLLEIEAKNSVSFKGLVGMNSDRSYSLDKRTFSDSMVNHLAMSTGFAGNVGVNRQTTIDMAIMGSRGYIKNSGIKDASTAKTLSMTEALTPFGTTRDDPFRTAMTYIQTSKHNMRIKKGTPLLVTNGADEALPYLTSDTFAFKAKGNGKVIKKTDKFMIVEYTSGSSGNLAWSGKRREIIDLRENVKKNSDGGFYITIQLETKLKAGDRFKQNDILAYDPIVYSDAVGDADSIGYNIGALAKVAFINTDEGFEDSAIISSRLADTLTSDVVVSIEKDLPINTNIFNIAKKGQAVQEGDTILLFQSPFDDEDANALVKNLSLDSKEVSELGRIPIKSKVTGIVQDIKLYRTCEKNELSPSLRKLFNEYDKEIEDLRKAKDGADNDIDLEADYKLPATGKLKNCDGKVKIEFYLKYEDRMGVGDKVVFMSALKGEVKDIFPEGKEPYTDFRPDEIVDSFCPLDSVSRRMVASVKNTAGLYKGVIELTRQMRGIMGIEHIPFNQRKIK